MTLFSASRVDTPRRLKPSSICCSLRQMNGGFIAIVSQSIRSKNIILFQRRMQISYQIVVCHNQIGASKPSWPNSFSMNPGDPPFDPFLATKTMNCPPLITRRKIKLCFSLEVHKGCTKLRVSKPTFSGKKKLFFVMRDQIALTFLFFKVWCSYFQGSFVWL